MFKASRTLLFGAVALFQLGALGWMIHDHEQILVQGTVYHFLTGVFCAIRSAAST